MYFSDRDIQPGQYIKAFPCDSGQNHSSIGRVPGAGDQAPFFKPIQQASYIRVSRDHAITYFAARQSFRRAAQDPQRVVLRCREVFRLHDRNQTARKQVGSAHQFQGRNLLRAGRQAGLASWLWLYWHNLILFVVTTIVNTSSACP